MTFPGPKLRFSHGRLEGRICFLVSSSFQWLASILNSVTYLLFCLQGQQHTVFESPLLYLFLSTLTSLTPSYMDPFY